jgi:hypothetical protein
VKEKSFIIFAAFSIEFNDQLMGFAFLAKHLQTLKNNFIMAFHFKVQIMAFRLKVQVLHYNWAMIVCVYLANNATNLENLVILIFDFILNVCNFFSANLDAQTGLPLNIRIGYTLLNTHKIYYI